MKLAFPRIARSAAIAACAVVLCLLLWTGGSAAAWGLARLAAVPVVLLLVVLSGGGGQRAEAADREERRPLAPYLGLSLLFWLLAAPVWIALLETGGPPDLEWTRYPYLDKRWLLALHWLSVGATLGLPWLFYGLHRLVRAAPTTARELVAALRGLAAAPAAVRATKTSTVRSTLVRGVAGLLLATALFGPPWHTERLNRPIEMHETVHWSGLQAMSRGYEPYLGPASVNYGPGLQLLTYATMRLTDRFTVPGFRATFGLSLWIAVALVLTLAFVLFRLPAALLAAALLPLLSPAVLWPWGPDGTLRGFWGWANLLRMIGSPVVGLATVAVVGMRPGRRADVGRGLALGLVWGLLSYIAQENLAAGGMTLALLFVLLFFTGTLGFDRLVRLGIGLGAGFAAAWAPALAYYGWLGRLGELWYDYTLVPGRFVRGYGNTAYTGALGGNPWAVAFYVTPFLAALLAVAVLVRTRPLRFVAPLDRDRLLVVAPCIALLTTYPSALLRSDPVHFVATLGALPLLIAAGLFHLPRCFATPAARWRSRLAVLALAGLVFWPIWRQAPDRLERLVRGRVRSLTMAPGAAWAPEDEIARRFGPALSRDPSHRRHLELMRAIKGIVGNERVFVLISERSPEVDDRRYHYAGAVYFLADLNPAPIWLERSDMVADSDQVRRFQRHFRRHVDEVDFVVSFVPDSGEIRAFQRANPGFTVTELAAGNDRIWIYGR